MYQFFIVLWFVVCAFWVTSTSVQAESAVSKEYVKAAIISKFINFVKWPEGYDTATLSSIDICVVGDSGLLQAESVFRGASNSKLSINLVAENTIGDIHNHCHVVFIDEDESGKLKDIFTALRGKPVLTISDIEKFADAGGMIGFIITDGKVKFAINPKAASGNGLKIDASLLEIAVKVIR